MEINLNKISKGYADKRILHNFSYNFNENDIYGVTGKNGSGKTTLFKIIAGLILQDSGDITFNRNVKLNHKIVSYIDNNSRGFFLRLSCIENLYFLVQLMVSKHKIDETFLNNFSCFGLERFINLEVNKISLGQSQILNIIKGHLKNPSVVLYDEVFSSLDQGNKDSFLKFVQSDYCSKKIQIFSSHDKNIIKKISSKEIGI